MLQCYPQVVARWLEGPDLTAKGYRLAVPKDAQAAIHLYGAAGLEGDPLVARTFPSQGLAVVPLPRDDALLAAMPAPPVTWLHSFRHECAHLLSLEVAGLRAAPDWFQEGFAELWCAEDAGIDGQLDPLPQDWPHWGNIHHGWPSALSEGAADVPGEVLYAWFADLAQRSLEGDPGTTPWPMALPQWDPSAGPDLFGLRGRHADWDPATGTYRIFTRPGKQVDFDLEHSWDGSHPLALEMQLGRSPGQVEAGVLLFGTTSEAEPTLAAAHRSRIRLRYGLGGGFTAYPEIGRMAAFEALHPPTDGTDFGRARVVHLLREGNLLRVRSEDFQRSFDLQELGLHWPLRLRMVVRDGAFQLQKR